MLIKRFLSIFLGLISCSALASNMNVLTTAAVGFSSYLESPNQNLMISDFIFDSLVHSKQHIRPAYLLSVQKQIKLNSKITDSLQFGPAIYYQQARFKAKIFELNDPEFYNYNAHLSVNTFNVFFEGAINFKTIAKQVFPFVLLGIGLGHNEVFYRDYALAGISPETNILLPKKSNNYFASVIGLGLAAPINEQIQFQLRYEYTSSGKVSSALSRNLIRPINLSVDNQALYIGFSINR